MTFRDEIHIALAIVAGLAVVAGAPAYLRKTTQLTAYLDDRYPQFWDRPDLLRWPWYAVDGPRSLRVRQLKNLILGSCAPKAAESDRRLKALVLEVRRILIIWTIAWVFAMISLFTLPFQPPARHVFLPVDWRPLL